MTRPVYPCLWFEENAKEAVKFYCSVFMNAKIMTDTPMAITFELNGTKFMALNGGKGKQFSEATSFVVDCETQEEIDHYWNKLSAGGEEGKCGWLKDKFGVSWQIVPSILPKLLADPDKSQKVIEAFLQMKKFEIEKLMEV